MITLKNISYEIQDRILFTNLNRSLNSSRYALVGANGIGKSTLAKIIAQKIQPTSGTLQSDVRVSYLSQHETPPTQKVHEYLASLWDSMSDHSTLIMELIQGIDDNLDLGSLSGGEWIRVRLAKTLASSPQFLILDEPSNNLDREGKEVIKDLLSKFNGGILLISHDRDLLNNVNEVLELSNLGLESYGGNFSDYKEQSDLEKKNAEADLEVKKRQESKRKKERTEQIEAQEKRQRRGQAIADKGGIPRIMVGGLKRKAQVTMNKIKVRESKFIEKATSERKSAWDQMKIDPFIRFDFEIHKPPANRVHFAAENLNFRFKGQAQNLWPQDLTFHIRGTERWWIHGLNGSGKTTLLSLMLQTLKPELGTISGSVKRSHSKIGYLDQSYGSLDPEKTLLENLTEDSRFSEAELRNELSFFGFTGSSAHLPVKSMSGGETLKASLAKALLSKDIPEILVLDEPTNNLDIQSQELLLKALKEFKGALIIISHDDSFVSEMNPDHEIGLVKNESI